MSNYSTLEHVLEEILRVVKPLQEDWETRTRVIDALRRVIGSVESLRGGWHGLQCIPNARVPILKFESSLQGISCDLSIDNLQGQIKSKILLWISVIDARFRDMVLLVKEWAKAHDINNPKTGTFNSYSLSLLVIFHFQTCVPAILPPLKDIYSGNIADDLQGVRATAERHIAETCAANITRFRQQKYRPVNRSSLSELFISFLEKFSNISLRAPEQGISSYTGQWEFVRMRLLPKTYALFIEDPFEQQENSARAVSRSNLTRISEAFQTTHRRLITANQSQGFLLLDELVRPQISRYIPRAPARNPTDNGRYYHQYQYQQHPTRSQVERTLLSTTSQQFRNLRLESRSSSSTLQNHNQGQHMWRARSDR
ncbi:protein HESO1 isoform X2 [Alnus glutinosa]|uniref:protein HESO1 isoform X2 n=1 Tax=Alnus glutinosa TaxID=3517 RepID=UPI002D768C56|nr:protein HESO1 isoform X2 [Alnus glutinosa]